MIPASSETQCNTVVSNEASFASTWFHFEGLTPADMICSLVGAGKPEPKDEEARTTTEFSN
jgi:hypothetical protein